MQIIRRDFKIPSHAVCEQWRTRWKIRFIFCLCALSRPFCHWTKTLLAVWRELSKFRFPKLDLFFRTSLSSYLLFQNEKLVEPWGGKSWLRGSQTGGEQLHAGDKQGILIPVILKSSKYETILISRTCPYPQDLPLGRFHGCLQTHMLFGKAKAKEMEILEEGRGRYPDQKKAIWTMPLLWDRWSCM